MFQFLIAASKPSTERILPTGGLGRKGDMLSFIAGVYVALSLFLKSEPSKVTLMSPWVPAYGRPAANDGVGDVFWLVSSGIAKDILGCVREADKWTYLGHRSGPP